MAKRLDFSLDFSLNCSTTHSRCVYQLEIFNTINICLPNETLLRMLLLDLLDKVAKRLDFHSTAVLLLGFFDKDQTHSISLDSTQLAQQGDQTALFSLDFLLSKESREK